MKKLALLFGLALLASVLVLAASIYQEKNRTASNDPLVWAAEIAQFEATDGENPSPPNATLFVGSSSIRMWETLAADMAPLVTIRRGFGGSRMGDVLHYSEELITRHRPAQVVISIGSNDINQSDSPMNAVPVIRDGLKTLVQTILQSRVDTEIYYLAITPSIFAWDKLEAVRAANEAARQVCADFNNAHFIATEDLFLAANGEPDKRLYQYDGLHLSRDGYERWIKRIKPLLLGATR